MATGHALHVRGDPEFGDDQFAGMNADTDAEFVESEFRECLANPEVGLAGDDGNCQGKPHCAPRMVFGSLDIGKYDHHAVVADGGNFTLMLGHLQADSFMVAAHQLQQVFRRQALCQVDEIADDDGYNRRIEGDACGQV